jgi:hypothetical protein
MGLRVEDLAVVLHLLTKRREDLVGMRTQTINRLHRLLVDLVPAGAGRNLTAKRAAALLAQLAPAGAPAVTRWQLAAELVGDVRGLDGRIAAVEARIKTAVAESKTSLLELFGVGPVLGRQTAGRGRRHPPVPQQAPLPRAHRHRPAGSLKRPGGTQWQRPAEQVWMRRRSGCVSFNLVHHGCSPGCCLIQSGLFQP